MKKLLLTLLMMLPMVSMAQTPYAALSSDGKTLTFYYDNQKGARDGMDIGPFSYYASGWNGNASSITTVVFDPSFADYSGLTSTEWWFNNCWQLTTFVGMENLRTENVKYMTNMFSYCTSLEHIDLSHFKTDGALNLANLFSQCYSLKSIDVTGFNTESVTDMGGMFAGCSSLKELDVTTLNTSKVKRMDGMFGNCHMLEKIDLSNFNTEKVESMRSMFEGCISLKTLDLSSFSLQPSTITREMFKGCISLRRIYTDKDFTKTWGEQMFADCVRLEGGLGTAYDSEQTNPNQAYAHVDGGTADPGYFTEKTGAEVPDFSTEPDAYAVYSDENQTLTFYYDTNKESRGGMPVGKFAKPEYRGWEKFASDILYVTFDESFAAYNPLSTSYWFASCSNLKEINDINYLNTAQVRDMSYMFDGCSSMEQLDASRFDVTKVTTMSYMFSKCKSLITIDMTHFWTENVVDMSGMFDYCSSLRELDVSNFKTQNVTDMNKMFYNCSSLTELDVSNFKTQNVKDMSNMFGFCSGLTSLDLRRFDTSSVGNMSGMFFSCYNLENINISNFVIGNCDLSSMFSGCLALKTIDLSSFKTSNVRSFVQMFSGCSNLKTIIVGENWYAKYPATNMFVGCTSLVGGDGTLFDSSYTDQTKAFAGEGGYLTDIAEIVKDWEAYTILSTDETKLTFYYDALKSSREETVVSLEYFGYLHKDFWNQYKTTITTVEFDPSFAAYRDVSSTQSWFEGFSVLNDFIGLEYFETVNVESMTMMFYDCSSLTELDLRSFNTMNVKEMYGMFTGCRSLKQVNLSKFNTVKVERMGNMFMNCEGLESLDIGSFTTDNVKGMEYMFAGCKSLETLDVSCLNTKNVTSMYNMFSGCSSLKSLDVSSFNTEKVKSMGSMFASCTALKSLDVSNLKNTNVENMSMMFAYCGVLENLNLSNFNTTNVTNMSGMFTGCRAMESIDVSNFNTAKVTNMRSMFSNCTLLSSFDLSCFDTGKTTDMSLMFSGCNLLVTLNLACLNTETVTNMESMFKDCYNLKTIYVGDEWSTVGIIKSNGMFATCDRLVGGQGTNYGTAHSDCTYARIDGGESMPGYLTRIGELPAKPAVAAYVFIEPTEEKMTFYYDNQKNEREGRVYMLSDSAEGSHTSWQTSKLKTVEFDDSFASYNGLTSTSEWFKGAKLLENVVGMENLNTENVTLMKSMFYGCSKLKELCPQFNTSAVTDMSSMFGNCNALTVLDLSSFETSKVTTMSGMFSNCRNLTTIYASDLWTTKIVSSSNYMFSNCLKLIGGSGTTFNSSYVNKSYACIDGGTSSPGYFTYKAMPTVLNENSTIVPATAAGVDVRVIRTIKANEWSTICLPFAMSEEQVKTAFGDDVKLGDFQGCEEYGENVNVKFADASAIDPNHPYIIKVTSDISEFTVEGVDILPVDKPTIFKDEKELATTEFVYNKFIGNYVSGTKVDDCGLYLMGGKFWYSKGNVNVKAFRGYFVFDAINVGYDAARINFTFDTATGISEKATENGNELAPTIYDLNGRAVSKPGKGIYVKNGKKLVVK